MANACYWARIVVINVLLFLYLSSILELFPFPFTPADWTGNVQLNNQGAANILFRFELHQYIGAANHFAPAQTAESGRALATRIQTPVAKKPFTSFSCRRSM